MKTAHLVIGGSWAVSAGLLVHLWKGRTPALLKIGLSLVLVIPLLGPFMYVWIQAMPGYQSSDRQDQHMSGDVLARWRHRLEAAGYLQPLRRWGKQNGSAKRRRK